MSEPTEKEIEYFLGWADLSCLCESYYDYHCMKCANVANGYLKKHEAVLEYCLEKGLVVRDSYHTLRKV